MSRRATTAAVVAAALLIACSKFGAEDGEPPAGDGGAIDELDAAPSASCVGAGFELCDRFERDIVNGTWDPPITHAGGKIAISTKSFTSGTRSLEVTLPAGTAENPRAYLSRRLDSKTHEFRVAFSMRYDAVGADVQVVNLAFEMSAYIFVTVGKDAAGQAIVNVSEQRLLDAGNETETTTATVITLGKWVRFELVADIVKKTVALTRDDGEPINKIPNLTLPFGAPKTLRIGSSYTASPRMNALTIGLDDVFYSAK